MIFLVALGTADLFRAVLFWCMDLYFLIRHSHPQLEGNGKVVRLVMLGLIGVFSVVVSTDPDYEDLRIPFILWLVTWLAFGVLSFVLLAFRSLSFPACFRCRFAVRFVSFTTAFVVKRNGGKTK